MKQNYFYLINELLLKKRGLLTILFFICCSLSSVGQQLNNGAWLSWDKEAGCRTYDYDPNPKYDGYLEDIEQGPCLAVCENGPMTFYMRGNNISHVTWEITGGSISREYDNRIHVNWGNRGVGALTFKVVFTNGGSTQGSLCIDILAAPLAEFELQLPEGAEKDLVCLNTPFVIKNKSNNNGGSQIVSYEWDFGDGNVSYEKIPQHNYSRPGVYTIQLKVTNECHCSSYFKSEIRVEEQIAATITCPTVSCEETVQTYTVESECGGQWFVEGGEIVQENAWEIQVKWHDVDADGFGYVSFISRCGCRNWTTVKIPIIKSKGTIRGNPTACLNKQQRFSLPQWPTTDFQWELISLSGGQSTLIPVDQRNEIVLNPLEAGTYLLVCNYTNTMLKCGGRAEFEIEVVAVPEITGPTEFCETPKDILYESNLNIPLFWEVKKGNTVVHSETSTSFLWQAPTAGFYTITGTHRDHCTSIPLLVEVTELPDISDVELIGELMVCPGAPYVYKIENDDPNFTYEWGVSGGRIHGSRFGNEVTITFNAGEFIRRSITVKKFSLNSLRCTSAPKRFNISAMNPTATFTNLENTVLFCPSTYSNFKVDFNNGVEPDHIQWESFPDNFANIVQGQGTKTVQVSWNEVSNSNSGFLRLTIRKCDRLFVFNHPITLFQTPNFTSQNPTPLNICVYEPFTVTLVSDSNLSSGSVIWNLNNGSQPSAASSISGRSITSPPLIFEEDLNDDIARVITATIINPNGCQTEIQVNVNVLLHPKPVITVTPNGNIFVCPIDGYAVTLYATHQLDIPDQNMEWYKNGQAGVLGYGPRYTVAGNQNHSAAGSYYVKMTSRFGCSRTSELVHIYENCNPSCTGLNETVSTSLMESCNDFSLTGTYTGTPVKVTWKESRYLTRQAGHTANNITFTTKTPGLHFVQYWVDYLIDGNICRINIQKSFLKPYEAKFKYNMSCVASNNTRDVTIIDNSIYADRTNVTYAFSRDGMPAVYSGSSSQYTFRNLPPGTYKFKIQLSNGSAYICSEEKTVVVKGRPNAQFTVNYNPNCMENPILLAPAVYDPEYVYKWEFNRTALKIPYAEINLPEGRNAITNRITLTVTDRYGCTMSTEQGPFTVNKALFPDSQARPEITTFCEGGTARLTVQVPGQVRPVAYQWMDGANPIPRATGATLTVNQTGNYWPVLFHANGCGYYGAISAAVIVKKPPLVTVNPPAQTCSGSPIKISATLADPTVLRQWTRNNTVIHNWSANTPLDLEENLAVGNYVYVLNVRDPLDPECIATAMVEFKVTAPPPAPYIRVDVVDCTPYRVRLSANGPGNHTYIWSNGMVGRDIEVSEGGPYRVRVISENGCEATQSIQVPKHSDTYMWVVPTGCIEACATKDEYWFTILGPLSFFNKHYWIWNDRPIQSGTYSAVNPLGVNKEGLYQLYTDQGNCDAFSKGLFVKKSHLDCYNCDVYVKSHEKYKRDKYPYSYIAFDLDAGNYRGEYVQLSFENPEGEGVFVPANISLDPHEQRTIEGVQFIPFNPNYSQSSTTLKVLVRLNGKVVCDDYRIRLNFGRSGYGRFSESSNSQLRATAQLTPNPTSGESVLHYDSALTTPTADIMVEVFDLLGKPHWSGWATAAKGSVVIPADRLVSGKYLVVLYVNGQRSYQHILIKN